MENSKKLKFGLAFGLVLAGLIFAGIFVGIKTINANQDQRPICIRDTDTAVCAYSPCVRHEQEWDRYVMLYGAMENSVGDKTYRDRIYYAEHFGDGIGEEGWKIVEQPILMPETSEFGSGESSLIHDPAFIWVDGIWHVYYTGTDDTAAYIEDWLTANDVFHATGPSLLELEKQGAIQGIGPTNYVPGSGMYGRGEPSILYEDGVFRLFYFDDFETGYGTIYLAESTDGHNFTYVGRVSPDITGSPSVSKIGDEYVLVFSAGNDVAKIYISRSKDPASFPFGKEIFREREDVEGGGEWDSFSVSHPYYLDGRIYYAGKDGQITNMNEVWDADLGVYLSGYAVIDLISVSNSNPAIGDTVTVNYTVKNFGIDDTITVVCGPGYIPEQFIFNQYWNEKTYILKNGEQKTDFCSFVVGEDLYQEQQNGKDIVIELVVRAHSSEGTAWNEQKYEDIVISLPLCNSAGEFCSIGSECCSGICNKRCCVEECPANGRYLGEQRDYFCGDNGQCKYTIELDDIPPATIDDLSIDSITQTSARLKWTSTGDDNNQYAADKYDIRYSTSPITNSNFASADELVGEPIPLTAGVNQSYIVVGLNQGVIYYFAIKIADEVPNWSNLSNIEQVETLPYIPPTCASFTYTAWNECQADDTRYRTVLTSSPDGCTSGNPILSQSCIYIPPVCASFTYTDWGECQADNTQYRTVLTSSPSGCVNGSPIFTQSCDYPDPIPPFCASFTYSVWNECQADDTRYRTVLISSPDGCSSGNPILSQSCIYIPPTCASFTYTDWGECQVDDTQYRTVLTSSPSGCEGGNLVLSQTCAYVLAGNGGSNGGEGAISDTTSPAQPGNFQSLPADEQITLNWNNPKDSDFTRVLIVRKQGSASQSKTDGINIYEGTLEEYTDEGLDNNKIYYYTIYSYDNVPNYSEPVVIFARPQAFEHEPETQPEPEFEPGPELQPEPEHKPISEMTITEIKSKIVEIQLTIIQLLKQLIQMLSQQIII